MKDFNHGHFCISMYATAAKHLCIGIQSAGCFCEMRKSDETSNSAHELMNREYLPVKSQRIPERIVCEHSEALSTLGAVGGPACGSGRECVKSRNRHNKTVETI